MAGPLPNLKWERFAREYASGESLASAYTRAGYADTRNAKFNASRLSHKKPVRERINELMEQFAEASAVKVEYLQHQILPMLRVNSQDLFGEDGKLRPIAELQRDCAAAIKSIKFHKETGHVSEIVLADKIAAAGVLLRSVGGLVDNVQVSDLSKTSDEEAYIKALEAAVMLFKALGLPQENLNELNAMIEQIRAEGFADDPAEADEKSPTPMAYHGKPSSRVLNGNARTGR
jgi:Terminase small subunit